MLDSLPYDILELIVFRLCLLTAGDIGALKRTCAGLNSLLTADYDVMRHHALGGLRHCLDTLRPAAALYALKHLGADPEIDKGRPLRVAIRTGHFGLFKWLGADQRVDAHLEACLKFASVTGAEWAIRPLMTTVEASVDHLGPEVALRKRLGVIISLLGDGFVSAQVLAAGIGSLRDAVGTGEALAIELASNVAPMVVTPELFESADLALQFAGAPIARMTGDSLEEIKSELAKYVAKLAGLAKKRPERYPGYPTLFRFLLGMLSGRERADLGYALVGVRRPDLAEEAVGPEAFAFVVGPSSPDEVLAQVARADYSFELVIPSVRLCAPAESLVRLVEGATAEDLNGSRRIWVLPEAMLRPADEAREILLAACPPALRDSRRASVERMLELGPRLSPMLVRSLMRSWKGVKCRSNSAGTALTFVAHLVNYKSAIMTLSDPRDTLEFSLGMISAPEAVEAAEVYAGLLGDRFRWERYRKGADARMTLRPPEELSSFFEFSNPFVFRHWAGEFPTLADLLKKATKWARVVSRVSHEINDFAPSPTKLVIEAALNWANQRARAGVLTIGDIVDLDLLCRSEGGRQYIPEVAYMGPRLSPNLIPDLAAAGVDVATSQYLHFRSDPKPSHDLAEFKISGVWPGVTPR